MVRIRVRAGLKSGFGLVGIMTALSTCLFAQLTLADGLTFAESGRIRLPVPSIREPIPPSRSLPEQHSASDFSLDYARHVLVPSMGGSLATGDFDGDGQPDLYVVSSGGYNSLFRNAGSGIFQDVTAKAGVFGPKGSLSAVFSDYDQSGRLSLIVAGANGVVLYHNNGDGTFSDVTQKAGIRVKPGELCTRAVPADIDGDGFTDLLVTAYTDLSRPPNKPSFAFPNDFSGTVTRLYRNNGHGGFIDVTAAAGLDGNPGRARNALIADFNADGRVDLMVLRDDKPPALYVNRGTGKFEDATWEAGKALTRHAFFDGTAADFDGDGKLDVALWSTMSFSVLLNTGNAAFVRAESLPLIRPLASAFGFHGSVADLDGNGLPDVVTLDNDEHWYAFTNRAGRFYEVPLLLSLGSGDRDESPVTANLLPGISAVCSIRPTPRDNPHFLALRRDGRIIALERITQTK